MLRLIFFFGSRIFLQTPKRNGETAFAPVEDKWNRLHLSQERKYFISSVPQVQVEANGKAAIATAQCRP